MEREEEKKTDRMFWRNLDVYSFISDIKLRLKNDITPDFILAKLSDTDKEGIIEMTANAYYSKKLYDLIAKRGYKFIEGKRVELTEEEIKYIRDLGNKIFDSYMTRIYMMVVLNRNVDGNYLVNVLSGYKEQLEGEELELSDVKGRLQEMMKNQEEKEK